MGDQVYTIMTINIGAQSSKGPGKDARDKEKKKGRGALAAKRREIAIKKIRQVNPDIIAVQEQNYKAVDEIAEKMMDSFGAGLNDNYYFCKQVQDHAAILVRKDKFDDIEKIDFDKNDAKELRSRLILAKINPKRFQKVFIAGSWHGPNTGADSSRVKTIENLVKTLDEGNVDTIGMDIAIGGDFNLSKSKFPSGTDYEVAAAGNDKIDYFIYHGFNNFRVTDVKESAYDDANAIAFLDHTPYIGKLTIPERRIEDVGKIHIR